MTEESKVKYFAYMKKVTDAFVDMQSERIHGTIGYDKDAVFYEVVWKGGLDYYFDLNANLYIKGVTFDEMKKHNANIAKKYLIENSLSFDEWAIKYGGD